MDYNKAALEMHESHHGKVGIVSKVEVRTRDDLSTAYTPGVAEPCRKIKENPDDVYKYTFKSNMVAVVSNGTAVLGLGDIGPEAGLPVMEGKAVLFKEFGGVDAFPICIDAHDAASVIAACKAIAPTFGGINLEDIKSPECFEIEETLERELDIPVFHDDQHGTAIVVTAALINALRVVGKKMEDVHIVLNGPGAAGTAIIKMLMTAGAKDIVAVDQFGTLYKGCNSAEAHKNWLGEVTNPRQIKGGLKEAIEGADVFIGVSRPGILTTELCKTMNPDAIVFAMANPTPEIMPDEAKAGGVRVMATGRSAVLEWVGADADHDADGSQRQLNVLWNDTDALSDSSDWQVVTNFIKTPDYYTSSDQMRGLDRYEHLADRLRETNGIVADEDAAMALLAEVGRRTWNNDDSNTNTIHSVVYDLTDRSVLWVGNEHYGEDGYTFEFQLGA